jgi:hypothetical protein
MKTQPAPQVHITLELSRSMALHLRMLCVLRDLGHTRTGLRSHEAQEVLAVVAYREAMGELPEDVVGDTPPQWRDEIHALRELRQEVRPPGG